MGLLHRMLDPTALARPKRAHSFLASSYDRRGGNHDWSNYLRAEGTAAVLMEAEGPGCITRIWTADPQHGTIRIYIDRAVQPAIEMPFGDLFQLLPLSSGLGGESPETYARSATEQAPMGYTSYCPIAFQHHCKVTIDPEDDYLYYQINYDLYPQETSFSSFCQSASLNTDEIHACEELWNNLADGRYQCALSDDSWQLDLEAQESKTIFSSDSPGSIREIRLSFPSNLTPLELSHLKENLWIIAHFDDDETNDPSIRAPLGPLFLDFGQEHKARTVLVGTDSDGVYYLRFVMPFHSKAKLEVVNRSILSFRGAQVDVREDPAPPSPELLRFRATWHIETPFGPDHRDYGGVACRILNLDGRDNYELLNVRAEGQFVGCGFHADMRDAPTDRACGEGDEMFFLDEDTNSTHYGTGAEDYVNDAWGVRGYRGPLSGDALLGAWGIDAQLIGYRLHLSDAIPFARKGRFTLEHGTGNNCSGLYRSIAYWYMSPAAARTRVEERRWEELRNKSGG